MKALDFSPVPGRPNAHLSSSHRRLTNATHVQETLTDAAGLSLHLGWPVASVGRTPYPYRSSHRLDELDVVLLDGTRLELLLKDLRRSELDLNALLAKPAFLDDPHREVEVYGLLEGADLGTAVCHSAGHDWLLLEKVHGLELREVGDLETWLEAARWLARLHSHFQPAPPAGHHLLRYDAGWFRLWARRATQFHPALEPALRSYEKVIEILSDLPVTLVHGEFYPSNVVVAGRRIATVDWEMAGTGPGLLDLAALATGWGEKERAQISSAYGDVPLHALDAAGLHLALQWLGRGPDWTPSDAHAHDWLAEALAAVERLRL